MNCSPGGNERNHGLSPRIGKRPATRVDGASPVSFVGSRTFSCQHRANVMRWKHDEGKLGIEPNVVEARSAGGAG